MSLFPSEKFGKQMILFFFWDFFPRIFNVDIKVV